jgi:hypothetical protein
MWKASLMLAGALAAGSGAQAGPPADSPDPAAPSGRESYPTSVLADYVLGCMISNGQSPDILQKCACSMDFIAAAIPYEEYEKTETLLRLQQMTGGGRNAVYKNSAWAKAAVDRLREVQAESTLRCF